MKTHLVILQILLFISSAFNPIVCNEPQDIPAEIIAAFKTGNSNQLAQYFNASVELLILTDEKVYNKAQAELVIKNFFSTHTPSGFTIIHEGGKEGSYFAIGKLVTNNGTFRVYVLLKSANSKQFIHQLRIENEAG
jgi:hypothetical protein